MKVTLDKGAKIPTRAHTYDAGLDLYAREDAMIPPYGGSKTFNTGVHVSIPESFMGEVRPKSGLMFNHKVVAGEGTVDCGYNGPIHVILFNHGESAYRVKAGDKIAQLVISPCLLLPLELVDSLEDTDRGADGFGSTGR